MAAVSQCSFLQQWSVCKPGKAKWMVDFHISKQPKDTQKPTSVYEGVFLHVRLLVESFATVLAGIRPGVWMYEQMSGERGWPLEHFSTHCTAKCPLLKQTALWWWHYSIYMWVCGIREFCVAPHICTNLNILQVENKIIPYNNNVQCWPCPCVVTAQYPSCWTWCVLVTEVLCLRDSWGVSLKWTGMKISAKTSHHLRLQERERWETWYCRKTSWKCKKHWFQNL